MADGTHKELRYVNVGDRVLSWNDVSQQLVASTVRLVPAFYRDELDLVELTLPQARLYTTEDHPIWSKSRRSLVSLYPELTLQEYGLQARGMEIGEELESEHLEGLKVSGIRKRDTASSPSSRCFGDVCNGTQVKVMTLCLDPFHWFYAQGVRVHNKGCFALWTNVLMHDHTQKPISNVRVDDRVTSWDNTEGRLSEATVIGIQVYPAGELYQINFNTTTVAPDRGLGNGILPSGPVVLTGDHPVYSVRQEGLVSMRPHHTHINYGISAAQMGETEVLSHYLGRSLGVTVQPWAGDVIEVMTLQLDRHHWFYVEGVRVHNKGGGRGGTGGGGDRGFGGGNGFTIPKRKWLGATALGAAGFAVVYMAHTRRRRGTWLDDTEDGCKVEPSYISTKGNNTQLTALCAQHLESMQSCNRCNECASSSCLSGIAGCEKFLADVYSECSQEEEEINDLNVTSMIFVALFMLGFAVVACYFCQQGLFAGFMAGSRLQKRRLRREGLLGVNGKGLRDLALEGTYSERGETKPTRYNLSVSADGSFQGTSTDDDGVANVMGKLSWPSHESQGTIMWNEGRIGVNMEAEGSIAESGGSLGITAQYLSSFRGVTGSVNLRGLAHGNLLTSSSPFPFGVFQGTVVSPLRSWGNY